VQWTLVAARSSEPLYNTPLFIGPYAAATVRCISMKALARYQVILLIEQRHIRCEQLVQGCCPNNATAGVEPATSLSRVRRHTTTLPSHEIPSQWTLVAARSSFFFCCSQKSGSIKIPLLQVPSPGSDMTRSIDSRVRATPSASWKNSLGSWKWK